jgi:serine/threonine-protein kinase
MPGTGRPSAGDTPPSERRAPHATQALTTPGPAAGRPATTPRAEPSLPKVCPTCSERFPAEFRVCPRDAVELVEAAYEERDALIGTTVADTYTIVRVLGEGGMGRVYEARHARLRSRRFALKVLHPELVRQPEVLARFQREAEAAAAIASPHVVDVYDVSRTAEGRPFIVCELLDGRDLATHLAEVGKMSVSPAVRVVRQVARALSEAHASGVVHRDLKPENVFLMGDAREPRVKVIDFGISKLEGAPGTALTKTGVVMGTPSYMAPEQARGEHVDHRADVYATGAILYAALTGRRPFDRGDPTATLTAVLMGEPARPRALEPSIPEPLELVIQRAMARAPEERYPSMDDLDAALAPHDAPSLGEGAALERPSRVTPAQLDRRARAIHVARPLVVVMAAVAVVALASSLVAVAAAIVRLTRGADADVTGAEAVLLAVAVVLALATPAVLAARHVATRIWPNSARVVVLAEQLRAPVVAALTAHGFASMLVRAAEPVVVRRAAGVAWPAWDLLFAAVGAAAALGASRVARAARRDGGS